jgi:hypothetical protein
MMNRAARRCIAGLDSALFRTGELITIARLADAPGGDQVAFKCENTPAKVTLVAPQEVNGTFPDSIVVISPTRLRERQWPVPPRRDDRVYVGAVVANIESVVEHRVGGCVVRYQIAVKS